ncbi:GSCOCG00004285001-RA-CDS [Cotesia congregata]|nr:GSCOCG00004285001-RA-CDS [Cotesia congregata]
MKITDGKTFVVYVGITIWLHVSFEVEKSNALILRHKIPNQTKWYKTRYCLRNRNCEDDQICGLGICINPCLYKKYCNNEVFQVSNHKTRCQNVLLMTTISTTNNVMSTTTSTESKTTTNGKIDSTPAILSRVGAPVIPTTPKILDLSNEGTRQSTPAILSRVGAPVIPTTPKISLDFSNEGTRQSTPKIPSTVGAPATPRRPEILSEFFPPVAPLVTSTPRFPPVPRLPIIPGLSSPSPVAMPVFSTTRYPSLPGPSTPDHSRPVVAPLVHMRSGFPPVSHPIILGSSTPSPIAIPVSSMLRSPSLRPPSIPGLPSPSPVAMPVFSTTRYPFITTPAF